MKKYQSSLFLAIVFLLFSQPISQAFATCASIPAPGNLSYLETECTVDSDTILGLDAGSGETNISVLTLATAGTKITINACGALLVGSIKLEGTGVDRAFISIQEPTTYVCPATDTADSGKILLSAPVYITDADADGYPANLTLSASAGTDKRRLRDMNTPLSPDCQDGNASTYADLTCYPDADGDTYFATASHSTCGGATCAGIGESATVGNDCDDGNNTKYTMIQCYNDADGDTAVNATSYAKTLGAAFCGSTCATVGQSASIGTDCCDSDANARVGQTTYFTTATACGGFDYNCGGTEEHYWGGGGEYCTCSPNPATQSCDTIGGNSGFVNDPGCGNTSTWKLGGCCNPSGDCSGTAYPACGAGNLANYQYTQKCR